MVGNRAGEEAAEDVAVELHAFKLDRLTVTSGASGARYQDTDDSARAGGQKIARWDAINEFRGSC
jgi:hypothetical protein